ncbi:MAG: hypothetical protein LZF60_340038 [Nitrospira sp.]|nr:MAG: hypothetical protein LZF60_340038 [Nitrospira sp.]
MGRKPEAVFSSRLIKDAQNGVPTRPQEAQRSRTKLEPVFSIRSMKDVQNGRPARPQAKQNRRRTPQGYVEDFDEPRTLLEAIFNIR